MATNNEKRARYLIIIAPKGASFPEELKMPIHREGDIIDRIKACETEEGIITVTHRELQLLTEYRDLFDVRIRALIGLTSPMYNSLWGTFVSVLERVTPELLISEIEAANDVNANIGQLHLVTPAVRRRELTGLSVGGEESVDADDEPDSAD
jgi:hypothetical protein